MLALCFVSLLCWLCCCLVQTLAVHTDSVWCLAASPDFSLVYSGGRDQAVYVTNVVKRQAWLLAREQQPVRDIVSTNCVDVWLGGVPELSRH